MSSWVSLNTATCCLSFEIHGLIKHWGSGTENEVITMQNYPFSTNISTLARKSLWGCNAGKALQKKEQNLALGRLKALTRNFLFCFQWLPCALVATCASVTIFMSSHSSSVGSGLCPMVFCSSSRRLFSRFSSISFLFANLLLSSNTTSRGKNIQKWQEALRTQSFGLFCAWGTSCLQRP